MSGFSYRWFVTFSVVVSFVHAGASTATGQVAAGGARVPGTTVPREAPLLNWSDVTVSQFSLGGVDYFKKQPFRVFSLEPLEGSQRWIERSYRWDTLGRPVVDETRVYPSGVRMVYAVTGFVNVGSSWYKSAVISIAALMPIASEPTATRLGTRRAGVASGPGPDPAALHRAPVAQVMGYQPGLTVPERPRRPDECQLSSDYSSKGPQLEASCVLLEPGQAVDLPNQIRIIRVGNSYRVVVAGSLVDDLAGVTIVRVGQGRYYALKGLGPAY